MCFEKYQNRKLGCRRSRRDSRYDYIISQLFSVFAKKVDFHISSTPRCRKFIISSFHLNSSSFHLHRGVENSSFHHFISPIHHFIYTEVTKMWNHHFIISSFSLTSVFIISSFHHFLLPRFFIISSFHHFNRSSFHLHRGVENSSFHHFISPVHHFIYTEVSKIHHFIISSQQFIISSTPRCPKMWNSSFHLHRGVENSSFHHFISPIHHFIYTEVSKFHHFIISSQQIIISSQAKKTEVKKMWISSFPHLTRCSHTSSPGRHRLIGNVFYCVFSD